MEPVDPRDEEPLFTVGGDDDLSSQPEPTGRPRWGLVGGVVGLLAVAAWLIGSLGGDEGVTGPTTTVLEPLAVDAPEGDRGVAPVVDDGWTWTAVDGVPDGQLALSVGTGLVLVDQPWAIDATWAFSEDAATWSDPARLPFKPFTATGAGARTWVAGPDAVASTVGPADDWGLQALAGVPPAVDVGWVAEWEGIVVAASRAAGGKPDWSEVGPLLRPDIDESMVVLRDVTTNEIVERLVPIHDLQDAEVRLVDSTRQIRLRIENVPTLPANLGREEEWVYHGFVPQTLWVGAAGSGDLRPVETPWLGDAAITADDEGFVAIAADDDATFVEMWRSTDGVTWRFFDGALVADVPIESVSAAAGGGSLVVEACGPRACERLVRRSGSWHDIGARAREGALQLGFPAWNGSEWWAASRWGPQGGASLVVSDTAMPGFWDEVPLPNVDLESDEYVRTIVLPGRRVVLAVTPPADQVELIVGSTDEVAAADRPGPRPPVGSEWEGTG